MSTRTGTKKQLRDTVSGTSHCIDLKCFKCECLLVKAEEIYRVYNKAVWTHIGIPEAEERFEFSESVDENRGKIRDADKEKDAADQRGTRMIEFSCRGCQRAVGHYYPEFYLGYRDGLLPPETVTHFVCKIWHYAKVWPNDVYTWEGNPELHVLVQNSSSSSSPPPALPSVVERGILARLERAGFPIRPTDENCNNLNSMNLVTNLHSEENLFVTFSELVGFKTHAATREEVILYTHLLEAAMGTLGKWQSFRRLYSNAKINGDIQQRLFDQCHFSFLSFHYNRHQDCWRHINQLLTYEEVEQLVRPTLERIFPETSSMENVREDQLYLSSNNSKFYVSIDIRSANLTMLKLFFPEFLTFEEEGGGGGGGGGGDNSVETWKDVCRICLKMCLPAGFPIELTGEVMEYVANYKPLRQMILGKLFPNRMRAIQTFFMRRLCQTILRALGMEKFYVGEPFLFTSDELLFETSSLEDARSLCGQLLQLGLKPYVTQQMRIGIFRLFAIPFNSKMEEIQRKDLSRHDQSKKSLHRFRRVQYVKEKKNIPGGRTFWEPIPKSKSPNPERDYFFVRFNYGEDIRNVEQIEEDSLDGSWFKLKNLPNSLWLWAMFRLIVESGLRTSDNCLKPLTREEYLQSCIELGQ